MQWGLLVEFSCNSPIRYLIALLRALLVVRSFVLEWRVVATTAEMMYIKEKQNLCWFHFLIRTLKKKSQYVIANSFLILPTHSTYYFFLTTALINSTHQERHSTPSNVCRITAVPLYKQITRGPVAQGCYEKRVANTSTQGNMSTCTSGLWYN